MIEETAVAKGIRRVSAVTAEAAVQARRAGEPPAAWHAVWRRGRRLTC